MPSFYAQCREKNFSWAGKLGGRTWVNRGTPDYKDGLIALLVSIRLKELIVDIDVNADVPDDAAAIDDYSKLYRVGVKRFSVRIEQGDLFKASAVYQDYNALYAKEWIKIYNAIQQADNTVLLRSTGKWLPMSSLHQLRSEPSPAVAQQKSGGKLRGCCVLS